MINCNLVVHQLVQIRIFLSVIIRIVLNLFTIVNEALDLLAQGLMWVNNLCSLLLKRLGHTNFGVDNFLLQGIKIIS